MLLVSGKAAGQRLSRSGAGRARPGFLPGSGRGKLLQISREGLAVKHGERKRGRDEASW